MRLSAVLAALVFLAASKSMASSPVDCSPLLISEGQYSGLIAALGEYDPYYQPGQKTFRPQDGPSEIIQKFRVLGISLSDPKFHRGSDDPLALPVDGYSFVVDPDSSHPLGRVAKYLKEKDGAKLIWAPDLSPTEREAYANGPKSTHWLPDTASNEVVLSTNALIRALKTNRRTTPTIRHELVHVFYYRQAHLNITSPFHGYAVPRKKLGDYSSFFFDEVPAYAESLRAALQEIQFLSGPQKNDGVLFKNFSQARIPLREMVAHAAYLARFSSSLKTAYQEILATIERDGPMAVPFETNERGVFIEGFKTTDGMQISLALKLGNKTQLTSKQVLKQLKDQIRFYGQVEKWVRSKATKNWNRSLVNESLRISDAEATVVAFDFLSRLGELNTLFKR